MIVFFLLVKIGVFLLLSALAGALIMYWWLSQRYKSIGLEYQSMSGIHQSLSDAVKNISNSSDQIRGLTHRIDKLTADHGGMLSEHAGPDVNNRFSEVLLALSTLENISTIGNQALLSAFSQFKVTQADEIAESISKATKLKSLTEVDFKSAANVLYRLERNAQQPTDFTPVLKAIEELKNQKHDEVKINTQLQAIKNGLPKASKTRSLIFDEYRIAHSNSNRIKSPVFGAPDDLKIIRGIGDKLEEILYKHGVFYYWQISAWEQSDISEIDALLEAFSGRIERDDWVAQAHRLSLLPASGNRPEFLSDGPVNESNLQVSVT